MITKHSENSIAVKGASYDLLVRGHIVDVILCGTAFASLDIRTAVNQTNDDCSVTVDEEGLLPTLTSVESKQGEATFRWTGKSSLWEKEYTLHCTYNRFRFFVIQRKRYVRCLARLQVNSAAAFVRNKLDPFDPVDFFHRVIDRTDVYFHGIFFYRDIRFVLFAAGFHRVRNQFFHLMTAAERIHAAVFYYFNNITAVRAYIKFHVFHILFLRLV